MTEAPRLSALSIVVPVFDERRNIAPVAAELSQVLEGIEYELIFVDDGSRDGTADEILGLDDPALRPIYLSEHQGKQAALLAGIEHARHPLIITMDGDLQDDPSVIPDMLTAMDSTGASAVIGARHQRAEGWGKVGPSRVLSWLIRKRFGLDITDVNSPLRLVRSGLFDGLNLRHNEFRFLPVLWAQSGHSVTEIEVTQRPRKHGLSKFRNWWRFIEAAFMLWTIPPRTRRPAHWRWVVSLILLAVLLFNVSLDDAWTFIGRTGSFTLGALAAANIVVLVLKTLRWGRILSGWSITLNFGSAMSGYLTGSLFGSVTPLRAGSIIRANTVLRRTSASVSAALASVLVDRFLDLLALICLATPTVLTLVAPDIPQAIAIAPTVLSLVLLAVVHIDPNHGVSIGLSGRGSSLMEPAVWTIAVYGAFFGLAWLLAYAMGIEITFIALVGVLAGANLISALPITVSGLGTREVALVALLGPFGVSTGQALAFALAYFLCFYASTMLFGSLAFLLGDRECD